MESNLLYKEFDRKINAELGKSIGYPSSHCLLNEAIQIFVENRLMDESEDIRPLLCANVELTQLSLSDETAVFEYPDDLLKRLNQRVTVTKDPCGSKTLIVHVKNHDDFNEAIYRNSNWTPSWDFEETIAKITKEGLEIGHNNQFIINKAFIDYYKKPIEIAFPECTPAGTYTIKDKVYDVNVDSELCNVFQLRKVTDIAVLLYKRDKLTNFQTELQFILSQKII